MRMLHPIALLLALHLAGASAQPANSVAAEPAFECYRVNYAWGFHMAGTLVDANGDLWHYDLRDHDSRPQPAVEAGVTLLAAEALRTRWGNAEKVGHVDAEKLAANVALVAKAAAGKITRADTGVRDAGSSACYAYVADASKGRYREIPLGSDGGVSDQRVSNDAPEAQALIAWLRSVNVAK